MLEYTDSAPRARRKHSWFSPFSACSTFTRFHISTHWPLRCASFPSLPPADVRISSGLSNMWLLSAFPSARNTWQWDNGGWQSINRYSMCHPSTDLLLSCPVSCIGQAFPHFVHEAKGDKVDQRSLVMPCAGFANCVVAVKALPDIVWYCTTGLTCGT